MKTKGEQAFENGFDLKKEVANRLNKMNLEFKSIKHYVISPYQNNRYKPEFVGQEVWITTKKHKNTICFTQEDFEYILNNLGEEVLNDHLYSIVA